MHKCGSVCGYVIRICPLVRYKIRDDPEITMKPADFFIAHERDLKQVDFVIIDKRSQIIRDTDRFVQCTITLPVRITEVEHDSF